MSQLFSIRCIAQSCPLLDAPLNGLMECDKQTVGGMCNFSCQESYTLRGATTRLCSPFLQWVGQPTVCDPPMCPELHPPVDGFVLFPCTREQSHSCDVVCAHGFTATGPTQQTCENDTNTDSLRWSEGPLCEGELCTKLFANALKL